MSAAGFRPSLPVRVLMLIAAYAPLLALLGVLDPFGLGRWRWGLMAAALVGAAATVLFLKVAVPRRNSVVQRVQQAIPREGEALRFFATYIVPFFVTATAPSTTRWALLLYLALIAALYLRGDLYFSNPLLALLGYRVFEVTRADRQFELVLSRAWHLAPEQPLRLVPLGGYIHVDIGPGPGRNGASP